MGDWFEPHRTQRPGEVEPGERPEDTAVREVKEETGLEIRAGHVIGERDHPATGLAAKRFIGENGQNAPGVVDLFRDHEHYANAFLESYRAAQKAAPARPATGEPA
jgi:8-oxo-dGTP pyrophosphatase MutT (NUDIX family)